MIRYQSSLSLHGISELAATQRGLITTVQLTTLEFSKPTIHRLAERGVLQPVRLGVYAFGSLAPDLWRPLLAAILAVGERAVASHFAALGLYAFVDILAGAVEITTLGRASGDLSGVKVHETWRWTEKRIVHGIPSTTPARAIADVAGIVDVSLLGKLVDEYQRRGLGSLFQIWDAAPKRVPKDLRFVLEKRVEEKPDLEGVYLKAIRESGLPAPTLQHPVTAEGKGYHVDFAWVPWKVGLEPKGWIPHSTRTSFDNDANREGALTAAGWRLIPATTTIDPQIVIRRIAALILP